MSSLVAVSFDTVDGASKALAELKELNREYLIDLEDAVVVTRDPSGKIKLHQSVHLVPLEAGYGFLAGAFWGTLVGLIFLNPIAGLIAGGVTGGVLGTVSGALTDYGIDDNFIKTASEKLGQNASALFILVRKAEPEKVLEHFKDLSGKVHVLQTSLTPEQDAKLRAALGDTAPASA